MNDGVAGAAGITTAVQYLPLDHLKDFPRWVAWRAEPAEGSAAPRKVPYNPRRVGRASATDPSTWASRERAEACAARLPTRGELPKGVGLVLGSISAELAVGGIDLDTCRNEEGAIVSWATDIIDRLDSYTEVSPSGTGLKIFFRYDPADLPTYRKAMDRGEEQGSGRKWAPPGGPGGHPPGIELYLDGRYFTVTDLRLEGAPEALRLLDAEALLWVINVAGPGRVGSGATRIEQRSHTDQSRSANALKLGIKLRREGKTYEEMCAILHDDPQTADWCREKGELRGGRELRRIWEKAGANGGEKQRGGRELRVLLDIAADVEVFHAPDGKSFADVVVDGHRETHELRGSTFRKWLLLRFFEQTSRAPSNGAVVQVIDLTDARGRFQGPQREVFLRVGHLEDVIYLDLGDDRWRVVEVTADGWRVINAPPIRFRRPDGVLPLPEPARGGDIDQLRPLLNVDDDGFVMAVAWVLGALRGKGPYPVLAVSGEQGSAKSTFSTLMRNLIDPNAASLRGLLRHDHDLHIAANNAHVLCFDNVSKLSDWLSDTLCRLATGGGFSARQLYTDTDEVLFKGMRPLLLNGIEDFVERPDLADRSIVLLLPRICDADRRTEADVFRAFEAAHAGILGALLDAVAWGLRELPTTIAADLPRMADFALWVTACEGGQWEPGTFRAAYDENRDQGQADLLEADAVGAAIVALMNELDRDRPGRTQWEGTRQDLLGELTLLVDDAPRRDPRWPKTPKAMGDRVRRMATVLRKVGIEPVFLPRSHGQNRMILRRLPQPKEEDLWGDVPF